MSKKFVLIPLLSLLVLTTSLQTVKAATITSATLDKSTYLPGQTGYISVTVYNDKSEKIRVKELSATINYYYTDGTVYVQKFFFPPDLLPDEIEAGQPKTYQIPISLPTNIASGYTNPSVEAQTDLWRTQDPPRWTTSDHPTDLVKLYIETPYKQTSETLASNVSLLAATTIVFASAAAFLMFFIFSKKARPIAQP